MLSTHSNAENRYSDLRKTTLIDKAALLESKK